ncbi:dipeptide ABC transporter ATP-binding protein [Anderseniella sp. Alg231-50]|uniref:dipeptide ABC transporter ATP-binding protein n=1 Tax=Anderseniella sp. Alg231-50 TaxID=1922226 RepID=UPI000D55BA82
MSSSEDLLRIEDLRISFRVHSSTIEAVKGASFRIRPGKVTALVGESGSGKSVIGQSIMGILPTVGSIAGGSITFNDPNSKSGPVQIEELLPSGPEMRDLRGGRIAMIFQEPMTSLSPLHTVGNQIEEALQLHQPVDRNAARAKTEEMLGLVGFPNPAKAYDMYSFELSGGLRQRAMIAMALICRPALLIADEPTTALDVTIQAQILQLLKDLQERFNMAILLITHDLGVVANMADDVVVIYHGQIVEAGQVSHIFRSPQHPYLKALLNAVPHFDMKRGERLVSLRDVKVDAATLLKGPVAEKVELKADPAGEGEEEPPLLSVRNLQKHFFTKKSGWLASKEESVIKAVDGVSLDIRRGECLGLVGESGCGKTTVSKLIMRAVTPDAGEIIYSDRGHAPIDMAQANAAELNTLRTRIQMVFQDPFSSLNPRMTVSNILTEPMEIHKVGTSESRRQHAAGLMQAVGLDPRFLNRYPHSFSGGQRQRIGIARALALNPGLLICDEPVSALDVSVQAQVLNLLKDLQSQLDLTYLFVSHNLAVIDYMADRIAVMCQGRIVEMASREKIFRSPLHPYTRSLLAAVPFPDLDRPLDYDTLSLSGASDDTLWPQAFKRETGNGGMASIDVGDGHMVLANANASMKELRA